MLVLNPAKKKEIQNTLAASKGQHQAVTIREKQTPRLLESLVKDGR